MLFKCCWYQEEKDLYGMTQVNFNRLCQKSDPYVLASQVQHVFYVEDPVEKMTYNVIKKLPRDWCDVEDENEGQDEARLHDAPLGSEIEVQDNEDTWARDDVPTRNVLIEIDVVEKPA